MLTRAAGAILNSKVATLPLMLAPLLKFTVPPCAMVKVAPDTWDPFRVVVPAARDTFPEPVISPDIVWLVRLSVVPAAVLKVPLLVPPGRFKVPVCTATEPGLVLLKRAPDSTLLVPVPADFRNVPALLKVTVVPSRAGIPKSSWRSSVAPVWLLNVALLLMKRPAP